MFSKKKSYNSLLACPNVITPDKIPTFFIPPNLATLQGRRSQRDESMVNGGPLRHPAEHHLIQIESFDREEGRPVGRLRSTTSMPELSSPEGWYVSPESPHTGRRESLFHGECLPRRFGARFSSPSRPRSHPHTAQDSDTASSTETSPYNSPLLLRSLGGALTCAVYGQHQKFVLRTNKVNTEPRPNSLSAEETSSTDTSPGISRRETEAAWRPPSILSPLPIFPLDFVHCRERVTKEAMLTTGKGGRLRLSTEYSQQQGRLRVRLISAEAFYQPHCDPRHVRCCVSLQLRPGLVQQQRSAVVKRSRNPIFNEDFFFEGVSPDELPQRSLRFKVINKSSGMWRDVLLGECDASLDSLLPPLAYP